MEAIRNYFNAEKNESILFVVVGLIAFVFAIYLLVFLKTSFYRGMAMPLLLVAVIQLVVGMSVWQRSNKDIDRVLKFINDQPKKIQIEEIPRMEKVMQNFIIYRWVEITLIALGLILMFVASHNSMTSGIGIGLFIQSSFMLGLDYFAEKRGFDYLKFLQNLLIE